MSLCPSCGHQAGSWQHLASCQPAAAKVPNPSRRRLEEAVPSRVTNRVTTRVTTSVVTPEPVSRHEKSETVTENTVTVTENDADDTTKSEPGRGRPRKVGALTAAERQKARRERLKKEAGSGPRPE